MRSDDWLTFGGYSASGKREPRFVVQIELKDGDKLSFTSTSGIRNIDGIVVTGVVESVSTITQTVDPLEGRASIGAVNIKILDEGDSDLYGSGISVLSGGAESDLTVGSSSELFMATAWPDSSGTSLTYELNRILSSQGIKDAKTVAYAGYTNDFRDYVAIVTSYLNTVSYKEGVYSIQCLDATKQMREDVFEKKTFRLAADLDDGTTSPEPDFISLSEAPEDYRMAHTAAFSDAPSSTVGYILVKDTGEIIRYTGISESPAGFTGITRGAFNTTIKATSGDYSNGVDNFPELEEFIYLEMPAPQMAHAVATGYVLGNGTYLPDHWNAGMPRSLFNEPEWQAIGDDLWDGGNNGLVLRFTHLKKTNAKKWIEEEIHRLSGTFSPINTDGTIGLARVNSALSGADYVLRIDNNSIVSHSDLANKYQDVINSFRVDYQWNGEKYLRSFLFVDADSIARNGASETKVLKFKGLHTSRHSVNRIAQLINVLQDRYRNPPQEISITAMPYYDVVEPNDVLLVNPSAIVDYTTGDTLSRNFEVQSTSIDWIKGTVSWRCFGATGDPSDPAIYAPETTLPDAFYTSAGTDISGLSPSIVDGSGNLTADASITGATDMNAAGAIYYYDGDLTIPSGRTLTISDNVQLRVSGTLTVNGKIDGAENGKAGTAYPHSVGDKGTSLASLESAAGSAGYVGGTCATDGTRDDNVVLLFRINTFGAQTSGTYSQFPYINIQRPAEDSPYTGTAVAGIPNDLRGTAGGTGGALLGNTTVGVLTPGYEVDAKGGDGGASGAGLCIMARGLAFGTSGEIDLSGADGSAGGTSGSYAAGTGAGGGPGALLVLIDGDFGLPDVEPYFTANRGATTPVGTAPTNYSGNRIYLFGGSTPYSGINEGYSAGAPVRILDGGDLSKAAFRVQYIPD